MKTSELTCAPLSRRPGANNAISKAQASTSNLDTSVSKNRYGITIKRGNFRRTQEDRVSIFNNLYHILIYISF